MFIMWWTSRHTTENEKSAKNYWKLSVHNAYLHQTQVKRELNENYVFRFQRELNVMTGKSISDYSVHFV